MADRNMDTKASAKEKLILLMPVLSGIMWGSGGIFVRSFDALGMDNFTMLFSRIIVSVAILGLLLFVYDRRLLRIRPADLWIFLGGGILGMFGINLTYNEAIKHGTLALASVLGLVLCLLSLLMVVYIIIKTLLFGDPVGGWPSLACMVMFMGGIQLFCMGILGQYLAKTYLETKRRPIYILAETDEENPHGGQEA